MQLSIVCPYYNEESIIGSAVEALLGQLGELDAEWELLVVNDGSTDRSGEIVAAIAERESRLRALGYTRNRGRGYALRWGIAAARGEVVVTTEIDLSWGEDIVERLYAAMRVHPDCDMVIASPHLAGGGYCNVPARRVFFSTFGNRVIRACMSGAATMNTGMTRAYRREMIQTMPLDENGKEFHLEVMLKAYALGYRFTEIPCVLEWKDHKLRAPGPAAADAAPRQSKSRIRKLIVTHTLFSLFASPIRYVWALGGLAGIAGAAFMVIGLLAWLAGEVAAYSIILGVSLSILGIILFASGVLSKQGQAVQKEIWCLRRQMLQEQWERRQQTDLQQR